MSELKPRLTRLFAVWHDVALVLVEQELTEIKRGMAYDWRQAFELRRKRKRNAGATCGETVKVDYETALVLVTIKITKTETTITTWTICLRDCGLPV